MPLASVLLSRILFIREWTKNQRTRTWLKLYNTFCNKYMVLSKMVIGYLWWHSFLPEYPKIIDPQENVCKFPGKEESFHSGHMKRYRNADINVSCLNSNTVFHVHSWLQYLLWCIQEARKILLCPKIIEHHEMYKSLTLSLLP